MKLRGFYKLVPVLAISLGLLSACGKPKFQKQELAAEAVAGVYTKPKIDIVIFQDNSDSVMLQGPLAQLKYDMNQFLTSIDSRWDYHFTVMPLLSLRSIDQKYIVAQNCAGLNNCLSGSQISQFSASNAPSDYGWITSVNSSTGSSDWGFNYMGNNLSHSRMAASGFLRSDAALAVVVVTNGEDTSGMSQSNGNDFYDRGDGHMYINYYSTNANTSFSNFRNYMSGLKGASILSKFYAVAAQGTENGQVRNCYGTTANVGKRYKDMAEQLNSYAFDLCSGNGLVGVLGSIAAQLQVLVEAYIFNYAVVSATEEPDEATIVVKKNGVTVPKSNVNGWSYVGLKSNQPTSYYPAPTNNASGYMIKLNGTAEYKGSDKISIKYKAK